MSLSIFQPHVYSRLLFGRNSAPSTFSANGRHSNLLPPSKDTFFFSGRGGTRNLHKKEIVTFLSENMPNWKDQLLGGTKMRQFLQKELNKSNGTFKNCPGFKLPSGKTLEDWQMADMNNVTAPFEEKKLKETTTKAKLLSQIESLASDSTVINMNSLIKKFQKDNQNSNLLTTSHALKKIIRELSNEHSDFKTKIDEIKTKGK